MKDFSRFEGGQCEVQSNLNKRDNWRMVRGNTKSITVTDTSIEIYFEWLAEWSFQNRCWTMINAPIAQLHTKTEVDKPSKISFEFLEDSGGVMIGIASQNMFLLLYAKDYPAEKIPGWLDPVTLQEEPTENCDKPDVTASSRDRNDDF